MVEAGRAGWKGWLTEKLTALFWSTAAFLVVLFGNGDDDLISLVLRSPLLFRPLINFGLLCLSINALLFLYIYVWLRGVKGVPEPLKAVPAVELLGAGSLAAGLLSFILGLWPVFGFLSPLIVVVTFYGGVMSLSFVPGFGLLRPAGDLVSGVRKQA